VANQPQPSEAKDAAEAGSPIGRVLGDRYRIEAKLGAGGMGAVYRATHVKLGSPVAVKILLEQYASDATLRKRFEREAKALGAVRHPNVVSVIDYGIADEVPYLVMELLEGETLSHRLSRAPFPHAQVQELVTQLLRALSFVHAQGLVHRDLKPANVFFERLPEGDERLKVLDFGLAKVVEPERMGSDPHLTAAGEAVGTPAYMAPEQITGGQADAATDVYAVGVILFQLLTGRLPFVGDRMEQLRGHIGLPPPTLVEANPRSAVRPELEALVQRALAKQRGVRFVDAAEMLAALDAVPLPWAAATDEVVAEPAAPEAIGAAPTEVAAREDRATAPSARRRSVALPMLVSAALIVGAGWLVARVVRRSGSPAPKASSAPRIAGPALGPAPVVAPVAAVAGSAPSGTPKPGPEVAPTIPEVAPATTETPRPKTIESKPRPVAKNPWLRGTPKELRSARKLIGSGSLGTDRTLATLRRYIHNNADDPRGRLLLGQLFINRHWRADAVSEYAAAVQLDASARGAPNMLRDLLALVAQGAAADEAGRLVVRAYGKEALPALARAIVAQRAKSEAQKRLRGLQARLSAAP